MELQDQYYNLLKDFEVVCQDLCKKKLYTNVVELNHELYRFLYPVEPTLDFVHKDPLDYLVSLISYLNRSGRMMLEGFSGYPKSEFAHSDEETVLEKKTSDLYTSLWNGYNKDIILNESRKFIKFRLGDEIINTHVKGKKVLDLGCGSGRNTLALSMLGAKEVVGLDYHRQSYQKSLEIAKKGKYASGFCGGNGAFIAIF